MKNLIFKPYLDMVKPIVTSFAEKGGGGSSDQEDDFDLSGLSEEEGKKEEEEETNTEENEGKSESEENSESEEEGGEGDEGEEEKGEDGESDEADDDGNDDGSDESASGDDKSDGKGDEEGDEEEDFFGDINAAEDDGTVEDYNPLATDLGIELEDPKSRKEFVEKVNGQIKAAQQKLDLTGYNETSQRLINFAKEHGDVTDFFLNPKISQWNTFLNSDPEDKYAQVRQGQLIKQGLDQEAIDAKISEEIDEMSTRELKDLSDGYDGQD